MLRIISLPLAIISLMTFSGCKTGEQSSVADKVITHFGNSCRANMGTWARAALGQTSSLMSTLEAIRDTQEENCKGISQALGKVQKVHSQLQELTDNASLHEYKLAQERRLELISALNRLNKNGGSEDAIAVVQQRLYEIEVIIAEAKATASVASSQADRDRLVTGLTQLTDYLNTLATDGNLTACLQSNPYAPFQMATSAMAIGGNFLAAGTGAAVSAIGQLMTTTLDHMRKFPIDEAILDLENIKMQAAMTCTLENISNLYCEAQDSQEFVEFALENYQKDGRPGGLWRGMDIVGRRLPVLNRWLIKVSNGLDPADPHAANRLNEIWAKHHAMRTIRNKVIGEINETKKLLDGVTDPSLRKKRIRSAVVAIYFQMMHTHNSPVSSLTSSGQLVCSLVGDSRCPSLISQYPGDAEGLIDAVNVVNGMSGLEARTKALIRDINHLIAGELRDTINQDPDRLVTEATQPLHNEIVPVEVMEEISLYLRDYVKYLKQKGVNRRTLRVIRDAESTADLLDEMVVKIDDINTPAVDVINLLFEKLQLLSGNHLLNERVVNFTKWELQDRIRHGDLPEDISEDLIAAGLNIIEQLENSRIYLEKDADQVVIDLVTAQSTSQQNLEKTVSFYGATIASVLKSIQQAARDAGETGFDGVNTRRLAHACLLVLTTSVVWPEEVEKSICRGSVVKSVYKQSGLELRFDDIEKQISSGQLKFHQRVCTYSNFYKASQLFVIGDSSQVMGEVGDEKLTPIPISQDDFSRLLF